MTQRSYLQTGICLFSVSVWGGTAGASFSINFRMLLVLSGEASWMVTSGGSSAKLVPDHMWVLWLFICYLGALIFFTFFSLTLYLARFFAS